MNESSKSFWKKYREVIFQLLLHLVVFISFAFDRRNPQITEPEVVFFLNYAVAALVINYVLLPRFLYKKKIAQFILFLCIVLVAVILIEENVLEKIYFPDTKGRRFGSFIFNLLNVLPVIAILSGFKFAWDALGKQREVDALKNMVKESELQFLKSQINPHFLFNNLNNLYSYAIENSPKTPEIILELSSVLRYMLYECKEQYVPLRKEVEQLHNFVKLSEMQIEDRGQVTFTAEFIPAGFQIAPLILSVFIENAFKHSTASQTDDIRIEIDLKVSESGVLNFNCKNSFHSQTNTDNLTKGIGLQNVRKRLDLLYPSTHDLVIKNDQDAYEVQLSIRLVQK